MGFFDKLKSGLTKTRTDFSDKMSEVFSIGRKIDEDFFEELEETLISADVGFETAISLTENLRERAKKDKIKDASELQQILEDEIAAILTSEVGGLNIVADKLNIILVIGVNGAGKTTSIGKMSHYFKNQNKKVILAAADTFRAAAIEQLSVWGKRSNVDVIKQESGSDPGAVVFDAVAAAKARKADILIVDTAGRLQNKTNLMEELKKISRIIDREAPDAALEVILVLDGGTGQNALSQAKLFKEAAPISGIILTKLDGTAKGGIVIGIQNELGIPVRMIGVGEGIDDLQEFNPADFAKALFAKENDENEENEVKIQEEEEC